MNIGNCVQRLGKMDFRGWGHLFLLPCQSLYLSSAKAGTFQVHLVYMSEEASVPVNVTYS